jgi:hypothetical protein
MRDKFSNLSCLDCLKENKSPLAGHLDQDLEEHHLLKTSLVSSNLFADGGRGRNKENPRGQGDNLEVNFGRKPCRENKKGIKP